MDSNYSYQGISNVIDPTPTKKSPTIQIGKYTVERKYVYIISALLICIIIFLIVYFTSRDKKQEESNSEEITTEGEEELSVINLGQIEVPLSFNKCKKKSFITKFNGHINSSTGHLSSLGAICTDDSEIPKIGILNASPLETIQSPEIGFNAIRVYYGLEEGMVVGFQLFDKNSSTTPVAIMGITDNFSSTEQFKCGDNMVFSGLRIATNKTNNKLAALSLLCKKI